MRLRLVDRGRESTYWWAGSTHQQTVGTPGNPVTVRVGDYADPIDGRRYPYEVQFRNNQVELTSPWMILKAIHDRSNFNNQKSGFMVHTESLPEAVRPYWVRLDTDARRALIVKLLEREFKFSLAALPAWSMSEDVVPVAQDGMGDLNAGELAAIRQSLNIGDLPKPTVAEAALTGPLPSIDELAALGASTPAPAVAPVAPPVPDAPWDPPAPPPAPAESQAVAVDPCKGCNVAYPDLAALRRHLKRAGKCLEHYPDGFLAVSAAAAPAAAMFS